MAMHFNKTYLFLILFSLLGYHELSTICPHGYPSQFEKDVRSTNLEMNYFCYILSDFQKWVTREVQLLRDFNGELNDFQTYISSCIKENKIQAAQFRLLRWINILNRKLFRTNHSLTNALKQINYEINSLSLEYEIQHLQSQQNYLNLHNEDIVLSQNICNLIEKIKQVLNLYEQVKTEAEQLSQQILDLDQQTQCILIELKENTCCLWY